MQSNNPEQQKATTGTTTATQSAQQGQPEQQQTPPEATTAIQSVPQSEAVQEEQRKAEEYLDQLRRTQAEFVNYRRRMGKEQLEGRITAQSSLLYHLLPVLDDLELALRSAPAEMCPHSWVQGLFLVARRLESMLDQLGVQRVGAIGEQFNPRWHETITTETHADVPEGTILDVLQQGYIIEEHVIRPARVSVAGASPQRETPAEQEKTDPNNRQTQAE
ncbi:protein GrpE [Ktedonobacter sp. SOSP1-85]|uniref:nucleotide exchange factor GrpE n=1 Tax=Ktedonobacter sp. SOSP1-85 TaxID=2778367 RepID=UPI0019153562|nr:nucleotide exchange factor GrpE [Ktedonobacter sp. SOSP1-85]GHO77527.1 protein GrpE [Ktedonobacter sp. SOSP1-85]